MSSLKINKGANKENSIPGSGKGEFGENPRSNFFLLWVNLVGKINGNSQINKSALQFYQYKSAKPFHVKNKNNFSYIRKRKPEIFYWKIFVKVVPLLWMLCFYICYPNMFFVNRPKGIKDFLCMGKEGDMTWILKYFMSGKIL